MYIYVIYPKKNILLCFTDYRHGDTTGAAAAVSRGAGAASGCPGAGAPRREEDPQGRHQQRAQAARHAREVSDV